MKSPPAPSPRAVTAAPPPGPPTETYLRDEMAEALCAKAAGLHEARELLVHM